MNVFKSFLAWVTGPLKPEVVPMSEVTDSASPALAPAPAIATISVADSTVVTAAPALAAPVAVVPIDTDKLHAILKVLGHELALVWDDAVALARKAR